jgi:hypothetical protein
MSSIGHSCLTDGTVAEYELNQAELVFLKGTVANYELNQAEPVF